MDIFLRIKDSRAASVIALYVITALIVWMVGLPFMIHRVSAAALTSISDTILDSDVSVATDHTISFITPTGVVAGERIDLTFEAGFNLTSFIEDDIDIASSTVDLTTEAGACSAADAGVVLNGQTIEITICTGGDISAGATVEIQIGTNATASGTGVNQIVNPGTTGAKSLDIGGTMTDSGQTRIVIIDDVTVTAAVNAMFQFTIAGLNAGTTVNGTSTTATSTATTLPFGTLTVGSPSTVGQRLTVVTNAESGFVVTVSQDRNLESSTAADIDQFVESNAAGVATPEPWASPVGVSGNEWTYGHMGFTSEDADLNGGEFVGNKYAGNLGSPRQIFSHSGSADGVTPNVGVTDVAFQVEINAFQEAGSDYSNALTYIATPTF